jgi:hypothetical protein
VVVSLCALALGAGSTNGQVPAERFLKSNQPSKRAAGSAKVLSGRVYVHHIFCSDQASTWTATDRAGVMVRMHKAYDFLAAQSRGRAQPLTFVEKFGPAVCVDGELPTDTMADVQWTERVIRGSCQTSARALIEEGLAELEADHGLVCLHVNKPGLSYNLAFYEDVAPDFDAERMVCFAFYPDGRGTAPATYAHEILHLFGAGDLYFPFDRTATRRRKAERLFPNDVMLRVDYDLGKLEIGPYTAFRIGWTRQVDPQYRFLDD